MSTRPFPLMVLSVLAAAALAGCIGGDDPEVRVPTPDLGPGTADNNTSVFEAALPTWSVGQWWAHHTYFGPEDTAGNHFNVVVVEAGASGYRVASQSQKHAMKEAETDLFDLGAFGVDLSTTYQGSAWTWYSFPLNENSTWTQTLDIGGTAYDLTFSAVYAADIATAQGPKEGFRINGTTAEGQTLMTYDYVVEMGWFSSLDIFDPADASATLFKIRNMGYGEGKTGEYFEIELSEVLNGTYSSDIAPDSDAFTVAEGTTLLAGLVTVSIEVGQATLTMTDPAGGATEYSTTLPGGTEQKTVLIEDPAAGEWSVNLLGLGQGGTAEVRIMAIVESVGTL